MTPAERTSPTNENSAAATASSPLISEKSMEKPTVTQAGALNRYIPLSIQLLKLDLAKKEHNR